MPSDPMTQNKLTQEDLLDVYLDRLWKANAIKKDPRIKMLHTDLQQLLINFLQKVADHLLDSNDDDDDDECSDRMKLLEQIERRIQQAQTEFKSEPGIWSVLQPIMNALRWVMGALANRLPVSCFEVKEDCDFYCTSTRPDHESLAVQNQNNKRYVLYSSYADEPETIYYSAAGETFKELKCPVDENIKAFFPSQVEPHPFRHEKSSPALKALAQFAQQACVNALQTPLETTSSAVLRTSGLHDFFKELNNLQVDQKEYDKKADLTNDLQDLTLTDLEWFEGSDDDDYTNEQKGPR